MQVEKVKILKTLKAGETIWLAGEILVSPLPSEIQDEVNNQRKTVEVLEFKKIPEVVQPVVSRPEFMDDFGNKPVSTLTTAKEAEKPKGKLVKRS